MHMEIKKGRSIFQSTDWSRVIGPYNVMANPPKCPVEECTKLPCEECMYPYCRNPGSKYNQLRHIEEEE